MSRSIKLINEILYVDPNVSIAIVDHGSDKFHIEINAPSDIEVRRYGKGFKTESITSIKKRHTKKKKKSLKRIASYVSFTIVFALFYGWITSN